MSIAQVIPLNRNVVRNSYSALLEEVRDRLADIAAQHVGQLDDFLFVKEREVPFSPSILSFAEAQKRVGKLQATFDQLKDWRIQSPQLLHLKAEIDGLAWQLECPTAVLAEQRAKTHAQHRAARVAQTPVVQHKKQRKVVIPTAMAA